MNTHSLTKLLGLTLLVLPMQVSSAAEDTFPTLIPALTGSPPEGFTIGKRATGYSASVDGSIYKMSLQTGEGEILVDVVEPWTEQTCRLLGIRIDSRTDNLFGAGCFYGNARVYDADSGALIMEYQLDSSGNSVINDLAITRDAVYFTDFNQPFLYKLPLRRGGQLPDADAAEAIPLTGGFGDGVSNGIVATPNGKTLIIGDSFRSKIFNVDPQTGVAQEIVVEPALSGFLDGIVMRDDTLYILTPATGPGQVDGIQVVQLDSDLLTGTLVDIVTDPNINGVASGAIFKDALYVNNARYDTFPVTGENGTEYVITQIYIGSNGGDSEVNETATDSAKR